MVTVLSWTSLVTPKVGHTAEKIKKTFWGLMSFIREEIHFCQGHLKTRNTETVCENNNYRPSLRK